MHPANPYAAKKPDFKELASKYPFFAPFVTTTSEGFSNIDWKDVNAVRALNKALLKHDWTLDAEMKEDRLCPPIPNRLDYLYCLLDLEPHLSRRNQPLKIIDIGTGAMAIYPLLLHRLRPQAVILATEKDNDSLIHAKEVLATNKIGPEIISILEVPQSGGILFPLLDEPKLEVDTTMCNPPFYASDEEMQEGVSFKLEGPHAAPSGAQHELICEGGEAAFVGQMITESLIIGSRCAWYTSLIGRYASLAVLIAQLKREKIDNYYIIPSQPAKTIRWILIWSHTPIRLPDKNFRSKDISASLLSLPNTWRHPTIPHSSPEIKARIIDFLESVNIVCTDKSTETITELALVIRGNTWSRAARRTAKQQQTRPTTHQEIPPSRAVLRISSDLVELEWVYGSDRADIDSFWKSMLVKVGLVNRLGTGTGGEKRTSDTVDDEVSRKEMKSDSPLDTTYLVITMRKQKPIIRTRELQT